MSENGERFTTKDVFYLVIMTFVFMFLTTLADSCHASFRYRDLRDRLQRLEQRP